MICFATKTYRKREKRSGRRFGKRVGITKKLSNSIESGGNLSGRSVKGSLTIEAALILPIFLYAIALFLYFFQMILVSQEVQESLDETARYYSRNAYLYCTFLDDLTGDQSEIEELLADTLDIEQVIEDGIYQAKFNTIAEQEFLDRSIIVGGLSGITIREQMDYYGDDVVDLCAYYECEIPILFYAIDNLACIQRVHLVNWTGQEVTKLYSEKTTTEDTSTQTDEIVYITETGTKYHTHKDCTYLKLSIQSCSYGVAKLKRNQSGSKYSACHLCAKNQQLTDDTLVYITKEGDRYHLDGSCSGLKRTIKEVKLSEVEDTMQECSRCKKLDGSE